MAVLTYPVVSMLDAFQLIVILLKVRIPHSSSSYLIGCYNARCRIRYWSNQFRITMSICDPPRSSW